VPGDETFWLNVVNAAFGLATVGAIMAVVVGVIREIVGRGPNSIPSLQSDDAPRRRT